MTSSRSFHQFLLTFWVKNLWPVPTVVLNMHLSSSSCCKNYPYFPTCSLQTDGVMFTFSTSCVCSTGLSKEVIFYSHCSAWFTSEIHQTSFKGLLMLLNWSPGPGPKHAESRLKVSEEHFWAQLLAYLSKMSDPMGRFSITLFL